MNFITKFLFLLIISAFIFSCKQEVKRKVQNNKENEIFQEEESNIREIFINMYLPNEMSKLFELVM